jgi:hypothetical protein
MLIGGFSLASVAWKGRALGPGPEQDALAKRLLRK